MKCSTFPLDTERQRGSGEILPSLFLSLFPSSMSLLHGSQDALCGGCGPWPLCQPSHSPWADHQLPEHSVLLDPLSKHTQLIKLFNFPTDAAAFLSSSCLLSSLSPSCSFIPSVFSLYLSYCESNDQCWKFCKDILSLLILFASKIACGSG